jgi:hypothetical protein
MTEHIFYIPEINKIILMSIPPNITTIEGGESFCYIGVVQ